MKIFMIFIFAFLIISCEEKSKVEYFDDGKISKKYYLKENKYDGKFEEYYENGNLKEEHFYKNGIKTDSSIYFFENKKGSKSQIDYYLKGDTIFQKKFYENGIIESKGEKVNDIKIGNWRYYRKNGTLKGIFEYKTIRGEQFTNQGWHFNEEEKFIEEQGNYIDYQVSSYKVKQNDTILFNLKYKPLLALNSNVFMCFSTKINDDYSNLNEIKLDTIYLKNNKITNHKFIFETKGEKIIKAFVKEYIEDTNYTYDITNEEEYVEYLERVIFFDFKITVE